MKVIRARVLGYCFGVKKAVEEAQKALQFTADKNINIYTLGPLIHNDEVLKSLGERGLKILSPQNLSTVKENDVVVIRAHGTTPDTIKFLDEKKINIINATCPKVVCSQKIAQNWSQKGFEVIIAGDKNHGEVTGIAGYAGKNASVIQSAREAESFEVKEKSILLAQTTFSPEEYEKIIQILLKKNPALKVFKTICSATLERQNALFELKDKVEAILVVGGINSANTKRLAESAQTFCNHVSLIENEKSIPEVFYRFNTVAITAGASTPDWIIDSVENTLKAFSK